MEWDKFVTN